MLKVTILSISLLTIMASAAVSPALGDIAVFFSTTDRIWIKLIITLPSIMIIPFSFLSGKLVDCFGKRRILFAGILAYIAGGIGGGFVSDITTLLLLRAFLGIGVGLVMPISTALISDFFSGPEAVKMTGWSTAANNLGGILAVILSGWLATCSWRYSFSVYLIGLIPLLLIVFFLPEPEKGKACSREMEKLPNVVFTAALLIFFVMTVFYAAPTNIAIFIKTQQLGDAGTSGLVLAVVTGFAFIAGALFSAVKAVMKGYMPVVQTAVMALGFYCMANAHSIHMLLAAAILIGFSFGNLYPMILLLIIKGVPGGQNVKAMAVFSSFVFFGQFFSPLFFDTVQQLTGKTDIRFIFMLAAFMLAIAAIACGGKNLMTNVTPGEQKS